MADCLKNIGCYANCDAILFPFQAMETGEHVVKFDWLGSKKIIRVNAVQGGDIIIPNLFNDHSDVIFTITQPSGEYFYWSELVDLGLITCPEDYEEDCTIIKNFYMQIRDTVELMECETT